MTPLLPEIGLGYSNLLGASLSELFRAAERAGFRRVVANPGAFAAALRDGWTEESLRDRLDEAGLEVTMIDALENDALPGIAKHGADLTARTGLRATGIAPADEATGFRSAEALRCPLVNLNHYTGDPTTPIEALAPAISAICRRAADRGLDVCLEFVPDTGIPDIRSAQALIETCGAPNLGILLDVFHHARSGGSVEDVRRLPAGAITAVQLSDRIAPPPGVPHVPLTGRVLPGEGELPLVDLMAAAMANNPRATVDIEVLNVEIRSMPPDDAAVHLAEGVRRWRDALYAGT